MSGGAAVGGEGGGVFGFKARGWWNGLRGGSVYVKESAGMVRVTVSRLQGDAPALLYFTTEDGSAQAGLDYEATSGHVFFRAREKEKTVKVMKLLETNPRLTPTTRHSPSPIDGTRLGRTGHHHSHIRSPHATHPPLLSSLCR